MTPGATPGFDTQYDDKFAEVYYVVQDVTPV